MCVSLLLHGRSDFRNSGLKFVRLSWRWAADILAIGWQNFTQVRLQLSLLLLKVAYSFSWSFSSGENRQNEGKQKWRKAPRKRIRYFQQFLNFIPPKIFLNSLLLRYETKSNNIYLCCSAFSNIAYCIECYEYDIIGVHASCQKRLSLNYNFSKV